MEKSKIVRLKTGAWLHFIIAAGHLACLFNLDAAFEAYGIRDLMYRAAFGHASILYAVTAGLAAGFAIAGLYALSAAGKVKRLPCTRAVCVIIVAMYSLRAIVGLASCISTFSWIQFISSVVPAIIAYCYMPEAAPPKHQQPPLKQNDV